MPFQKGHKAWNKGINTTSVGGVKKCSKCKLTKTLSEFYKNKCKLDGYNYYCKVCFESISKERKKIWYLKNKERISEHQRNYSAKYYLENKERVLERQKMYLKTESGKKQRIKSDTKLRKKYPKRHNARRVLHYWVKKGKLAHLACEICGNFLSEAHHPDYNKPLEVWWLCRKHHTIADRGELELYQ